MSRTLPESAPAPSTHLIYSPCPRTSGYVSIKAAKYLPSIFYGLKMLMAHSKLSFTKMSKSLSPHAQLGPIVLILSFCIFKTFLMLLLLLVTARCNNPNGNQMQLGRGKFPTGQPTNCRGPEPPVPVHSHI